MVAMRTEVLPPHDIASEEAVIAAILLDESAVDKCLIMHLDPADFFREHNGWVYDACLAAVEDGRTPTITVVAHYLDRAGRLDAAGGEPYLADISSKYFTAVGVETHISILLDTSRARRIIAASGRVAQSAYEGKDSGAVIAKALELFGGLLTDKDAGLEKLGMSTLEQPDGSPWVIPVLDMYTMGMSPGLLTIFAGRTGEGKSTLAAQVARTCAENGGRVVIFTMEMENREYESRMAHAISGVRKRYSRLDAPLTDVERSLLLSAQQRISEWDILSSSRPGVTAGVVTAAVRAANAERHVDLVVVDYLQLMGRSGDNDAEALKSITKELKNMAREVGCHVIVVSQMNRSSLGELRGKESQKADCIVTGDKYPIPFAESLMGGAVENDADLVVMLQRHPGEGCKAHMEVCIVKNRNGVTGHGMMISDFGVARLTTLTVNEIEHIARGDMGVYRALMKDQGLYKGEYSG